VTIVYESVCIPVSSRYCEKYRNFFPGFERRSYRKSNNYSLRTTHGLITSRTFLTRLHSLNIFCYKFRVRFNHKFVNLYYVTHALVYHLICHLDLQNSRPTVANSQAMFLSKFIQFSIIVYGLLSDILKVLSSIRSRIHVSHQKRSQKNCNKNLQLWTAF
jgi:hypothetical protein